MFGRSSRESEDLREFIREMTARHERFSVELLTRNERVWREVTNELREGRRELRELGKSIRDMGEQIQANTRAVLRVLDRLEGQSGNA